MELKPVGEDIQLIYQCPACETRHHFDLKTVQRPGQYLDCWCDTSTRLAQVTQPKFTAQYGVTTSEPITKDEPKDTDTKRLDAMKTRVASILFEQGFSGDESDTLIKEVLSRIEPRSVAELLRLALVESRNDEPIKTG